MYEYRAQCIRVIDGNTMILDLDLGLSIHTIERIRLAGIDVPAVRTKDAEEKKKGREAKAALERMLMGRELIVLTDKGQEPPTRYVGTVYLDHGEEQISVNAEMVKMGYAIESEG
jgi:micrococcal nuclease